MAIDCSSQALAEASACYCFTEQQMKQVKIYLLAVMAGLDDKTATELAEAAKCYCYDPVTAMKVELYLECKIAEGYEQA